MGLHSCSCAFAGLQCSLVDTRGIDGTVRYEHVASLGSVPASPSVAHRLAFWRRFYEQLAELANRIDAETQGKIISAVHSRIPIVTPDEQRALRVRPRPQRSQKALRHEEAKEGLQNETPASGGTAGDSTLPLPRIPSLPTAEQKGTQTEEHSEAATERNWRAVSAGQRQPTNSGASWFISFTTHHFVDL
jgi:hypothetical protein